MAEYQYTSDEAYERACDAISRAEVTRAQSLDLSDYGLRTLPREIGRLSSLTNLDISNNQLTFLPAELGKLSSLTDLDLSTNQLTLLPPWIGRLSSLTFLDVSRNKLTSLAREVCQLTTLVDFNASKNGLRLLLPEVGQLTRLVNLNLSENELTALPPDIGRMAVLKHLRIYANKLEVVPEEIGQLANLQSLEIASNRLIGLPKTIGYLKSLVSFYVWGNQLTSLPENICLLPGLEILDISRNQLTSLPAEIGRLTQLREFDVAENSLSSLPKEIGLLTSLVELVAQGNNLATLPAEINNIPHLKVLLLHGNDLLGIPQDVLGTTWYDVAINAKEPADPRAILDFYFERDRVGGKPLNEVKVLLLGRGGVGKSSLVDRLVHDRFDRDKRETPGIAIEDWLLPSNGTTYTAHIWDFAGQEIAHETHRFFLSSRSLYLVVLDGRNGQQMQEAEYWLQHAAKYGEGSPVIVVLNKWRSDGPYDIEKGRLQRDYPNIRHFVHAECEEAGGAETLKAAIIDAVRSMDSVHRPWPNTYARVRQRLLDLQSHGTHYLSFAAFEQECKACGIDGEERQEDLAINLNQLGAALYYGRDPRLFDTRVLSPNWVANGLYALLRGVEKNPLNRDPGELRANDVGQLLKTALSDPKYSGVHQDHDYPLDVHRFLLDLMFDREIAFATSTQGGEEVYLVPSLLPVDEPDAGHLNVAAFISTADLQVRYQYDLLPAGLLARFIARTSTLSEGRPRWRRGVSLGWNTAEALIIASASRNRIDVHVTGAGDNDQQELIGIIRSTIAEIHGQLPAGMAGKEELELMAAKDKWNFVPDLEALRAVDERLQVIVDQVPRQVDVKPELQRLRPDEAVSKDAPRSRLFLSYAHLDGKYCKRFQANLRILENQGLVSTWHDGIIKPDQDWDKVIRNEIRECDIVIFLITTHLLASGYCSGVEVQIAREQAEKGQCRILPIVVEAVEGWQHDPWLGPMSGCPRIDGITKPIVGFPPNQGAGWNEVSKHLRQMILEMVKDRPERHRRLKMPPRPRP